MSKLKIHYVSGSRADFGLVRRSLQTVRQSGRHDIGVVVTGQHLSQRHGKTVQDIVDSDLPVVARIEARVDGGSGAEMAFALADMLRGFTALWQNDRPDLVLLLGDRGEMVAAALAAVHLGLHVAHIHGGERSGTLDESFRHVISKLAHIHFPATEDAAERLRRMGEAAETVFVIGAPGLVGVADRPRADRVQVAQRFGLSPDRPIALVVFHPVVQEAAIAASQFEAVMESVQGLGLQAVLFRPNSDAGGRSIDAVIDGLEGQEGLVIVTHLARDDYLDVLQICDVMVGNSSSGIIESASFQVPCVNIGSRQNGRFRNANTLDCPEISSASIRATLSRALAMPRRFVNLYGDGQTDRRLLEHLDAMDLTPEMLNKINSF